MSQFGKYVRDLIAGAYQMKDKKKKQKGVEEGTDNSVARVTEIIASSTVSFDDAVTVGIARACKTLQNVTAAWVQDQKVEVSDGKIQSYRVNLKITFILKD
jgi:flavin-binding protein dodecin